MGLVSETVRVISNVKLFFGFLGLSRGVENRVEISVFRVFVVYLSLCFYNMMKNFFRRKEAFLFFYLY